MTALRMTAIIAARIADAAGVRWLRSTTVGSSARKNAMTFGLPSVSDRLPRNSRSGRVSPPAAASPGDFTGAVQIFQAMKRR